MSHRPNPSLLRRGALLAVVVPLAAGLAACGEAATRSTSRFCGELQAHATEIQTPPATVEEIPALITLYSKMAEVAPLEIQGDWETVYGVLKTANTVNSADPASVQLAVDAAYAANQAAVNVEQWATTNCKVDIPVAIVPGGIDVETTTTTAVPPAG